MAKRKTTVYIDEDLLRSAKIEAARSGKADSQVFEEALRRFLGLEVLDRVWTRNAGEPLTADAALTLAYSELDAVRSES